jgi:hypothetical protein
VANHRPDNSDDGRVGQAFLEALAEAIRLHLPGAVGLVLKGVPLCALMAFTHFVIGTDWFTSALLGGALRWAVLGSNQ